MMKIDPRRELEVINSFSAVPKVSCCIQRKRKFNPDWIQSRAQDVKVENWGCAFYDTSPNLQSNRNLPTYGELSFALVFFLTVKLYETNVIYPIVTES